ncbi:MAG: 23S rRNA (guanosine(2251)-2'-O)-methyltransferase RlmB, partial [Nitrospirae bacterium]
LYRAKEPPFFIILDGVKDPRNLGAIIRTAEAGGVDGIVFSMHRAAGLGPGVYKSSAGAWQYVPLCRLTNIKRAIRTMKEKDITIFGTTSSDEDVMSIWDVDFKRPAAVILGSEEKGISRTVKEQCDELITIPMKGRISSLNVSVAAGIVIYEALRQRSTANSS